MPENNYQALYDEAVAFYEKEEFSKARDVLNQILAQSPLEYPAINLLAAVSYKLNEFLLAEEMAVLGLSLDPDDQLSQDVLKFIENEKKSARNSFYHKHYMLSRSRFMHYPNSVSIETTGRCNAACTFCPHPDLDRNKSSMSDEMFEKIIADLEEIPKDHEFTITPGVVNEPFMDKKFFPRLRLINERIPQAELTLFSNLNVMHRDFAEQITSIRNISYINVSFNAANAQEYEAVMKINFDRTVRNLKMLMSLNQKTRFTKMPIILSRVGDLTESDDRYGDEVRALFSEFIEDEDYQFKVKARTNWLDKLDIPSSDVPTFYPCTAWFDLYIHNDGKVPHCCMDSDAAYAIGDITKNSVLEIYNGPHFKYLRESMPSRGVAGSPCNKCALL